MIKELYFISGLYCDFCHIFIWMTITLLHHKIPTKSTHPSLSFELEDNGPGNQAAQVGYQT